MSEENGGPAVPVRRPLISRRDLAELALLLLALWLLRLFVVEPYTIRGASMAPNLADYDRVLVNKVALAWRDPERGEVVVVDPPVTHTAPYIKRVVGVPGDEVILDHGRLIVNGVTIDEPHIRYVGATTMGPFTLGADEYWLLGDNRDDSQDSRFFGPVTKEQIRGIAQLRLWPLGRFGALAVPTVYP